MNNDKRTIFIWDVHWCFDEFELLIEKLKIQDDDTVYLVWDMINKWPKSWKMIKFLYKNQDQYRCILWNHEVSFKKRFNSHDFWNNFSSEIFEKLKNKFSKNPDILEYFNSIPLYIEKEDFLLIHWWLNPDKKLSEHTIDEITKIREINDKPWFEQYTGNTKIIYWHWALNWLSIRWNTIWLDTWCLYGWALTAYVLETWDIYSQPALDIYQDIFTKIQNYEFKWIKKNK